MNKIGLSVQPSNVVQTANMQNSPHLAKTYTLFDVPYTDSIRSNSLYVIVMEVKNGIIIDGVLHEASLENIKCGKCSLHENCQEYNNDTLCNQFDCLGFVNRGKVKIEKEGTE